MAGSTSLCSCFPHCFAVPLRSCTRHPELASEVIARDGHEPNHEQSKICDQFCFMVQFTPSPAITSGSFGAMETVECGGYPLS